jgi:hypothetical protein
MVAPLEQLTTNLGVGGSNPSERANEIKSLVRLRGAQAMEGEGSG